MNLRISFVLFAAFAIAASAGAQDAKKPMRKAPMQHKQMASSTSGRGYGIAGCGLGSLALGAQPGFMQVFAATLNGTGGQTFAITSGTSNCDIPAMGQQAAAFIEVNKETVAKDAARGSGETVSSLAHILNCQDSSLFGAKLQQNYGQIFSSGNSSYETTRRILTTIKNDGDLKKSCPDVG